LSYSKDEETQVIEILQTHHYYPFGLEHISWLDRREYVPISVETFRTDGSKVIEKKVGLVQVANSGYQYQYNGKEWQDEMGLNWYDYGARNYDASLGRWMNVDPLAEKYPGFSPYVYTFNNPINFVDPSGMEGEDWVNDGGIYRYDERVVDKETAKQYYGSEDSYVGKSATVTTSDGVTGEIIDKVNLNTDGSVTKGDVTLNTNSTETFYNAAGSRFIPKQTSGSFIGFSANFAFMGGFGISIGNVVDAVGDSKNYFSFNGNLGFGLSYGLDTGSVIPKEGNQFYSNDFAGETSNYSFGVDTPVYSFGLSGGGTVDATIAPGDKVFAPSTWGINDRGYTTEETSISLPGKIGGSIMYTNANTFIH
jgi:RHS repeat-associated protein